MTSSLVGSEMCIRDSWLAGWLGGWVAGWLVGGLAGWLADVNESLKQLSCLLYTSDAADDM
eukprot:8491406-Prorocentrum_lima.AAC.1